MHCKILLICFYTQHVYAADTVAVVAVVAVVDDNDDDDAMTLTTPWGHQNVPLFGGYNFLTTYKKTAHL